MNLNWLLAEKRLGLTLHIFTRISELLEMYKKVIIVEDDISTSAQSIRELLRTDYLCESRRVLTQGLFGAFPKNGFEPLLKNRWRRTNYFSAWGWTIDRDSWSLYDYKIVKKVGLKALSKNSIWVNLSPNQRKRWTHRFSRVASDPLFTWDYQMQFISWLHKLDHLLPLWRLCDNEGFEDERASNTKLPKPHWYLGRKSNSSTEICQMREGSLTSRLINYVDSCTWVGDRKPSDLIMSR